MSLVLLSLTSSAPARHEISPVEEKAANTLQPIADKLGVSQAQLSLAWCLKNPNVSSVITGASRPEQVIENCKALTILDKLTPEVLKEIDDIVGKVELDPARQD
jgi:aryl-alcohol dehydrogenase-like predicted oxidoreductase